jgi:hypothetical protein
LDMIHQVWQMKQLKFYTLDYDTIAAEFLFHRFFDCLFHHRDWLRKNR